MQNNDRIHRRYKGYIAPPGGQAHPVQGFYAELLKKLKIKKQPPPPPPPEAQPREPVPLPRKKTEETWERAQKVFGSRDKAAVERRKQWQASTQNIAGVMVPPRPTEPDNCCMSGCVNCVWDMYRDEMEEWAAKSAEARARMQAQNKDKQDGAKALAARDIPSLATSMDDDGGGSETNWVPSESKVDLFEDIPVGIREFMRTEKALKQKHRAEQTPSAP
ncbi:hypothetical protein CC80DRAFT_405481 [Byssothecium circinans]|uniref:Oxidoreductase-like domain-containing protein n=1 Tax=Byssothecium circinans TaxID=147558 RepID=A0A6A5U732_9PLEO|nr:hypothetical protein CC80DRAFT_405481 [Byssothecium circinans]